MFEFWHRTRRGKLVRVFILSLLGLSLTTIYEVQVVSRNHTDATESCTEVKHRNVSEVYSQFKLVSDFV